ncbi:AraC-like DNA-binding protein [Larkinella arboricola]|uniref:AraC-like DNA-binding protein n=1 Tax=Larkinella arboricola TaxID=643671 RepID=A0A327WWY5_LARAB|nr:helix-turn-helix domain-containing protein [Larkinella arboricola]RAJ97817.1 AraC-like DNA-binding protein [Larkinella arboricola]
MVQQLLHRHPALRPYVKDILVLEGCEQVISSNSFRFYADGCPGIVFQQSVRSFTLNEERYPSMSIFLYGQTLKPVHIATDGRFRIVIFMLHPYAIRPLLGLKADELTDTCFDLGELPTLSGVSLLEGLSQTDCVTDQVETIASCLLRMLQLNYPKADRMLDFAVSRIRASNGHASLVELQKTLHISERTFERRFEQYIGISPRLFARICRFQSTLKQLTGRKYEKLSDVAFDNGYADQSHFTRSFREFTGFSPLKLHRFPDPFAENRSSIY